MVLLELHGRVRSKKLLPKSNTLLKVCLPKDSTVHQLQLTITQFKLFECILCFRNVDVDSLELKIPRVIQLVQN